MAQNPKTKRATVGKIVAGVNIALNGAGIAAAVQGALPPKYALAGLLTGIILQSLAPSVLRAP